MPWEVLTQLVQHGAYRGSRATVLGTLIWVLALLVGGLVGSVSTGAPEWVQVLFGVMLAADFVAILVAFAYFAARAPDALRSERFSIQKIAIERGIYGDSGTGLIEPRPQSTQAIEEIESLPPPGDRNG